MHTGTILLLNEWLFHDLTMENGEYNFRETARFLMYLQDAQITLVVPSEKRWLDKAGRLFDDEEPRIRTAARIFNNILRDSNRTIWTNYEQMETVPEDLYSGMPEEDIYLIKAYVPSGANLLVTSDTGLFRACELSNHINCQLRDDFLKTFVS